MCVCVCVCVCDMIFVYSNTTLNILLFTWYAYNVFFFFNSFVSLIMLSYLVIKFHVIYTESLLSLKYHQ